MQLRSFQLADIYPITEIWKLNAINDLESQTLKILSQQLSLDRDLVVVAENDHQEVIGAIMGTMDGSNGFFYCLAVHPDYHGNKVGTQLVETLKERFERKGAKDFWVRVDEGTRKLRTFYEKLGLSQLDLALDETKLCAI